MGSQLQRLTVSIRMWQQAASAVGSASRLVGLTPMLHQQHLESTANSQAAVLAFSTNSAASQQVADTRQVWEPHQKAATGVATVVTSSSQSASPRTRSSAEQAVLENVHKVLQDMGLTPGKDCEVADGLATVDIGLFLQGKKVGLQVSSEAEAASQSSPRVLAMELARKHVLQANGWHTATIPADNWHTLQDEGSKQQYLIAVIKDALGQGHKHHHHHHAGCGCSH